MWLPFRRLARVWRLVVVLVGVGSGGGVGGGDAGGAVDADVGFCVFGFEGDGGGRGGTGMDFLAVVALGGAPGDERGLPGVAVGDDGAAECVEDPGDSPWRRCRCGCRLAGGCGAGAGERAVDWAAPRSPDT
jgi:hypothetical protein